MTTNYINLWIILFAASVSAGFAGVILNKNKNLLMLLMFLEIIYLGISIGFLGFSYTIFFDLRGQIMSISLLALSAAESAIGLALIVSSFKKLGTIDANKFNIIKY